MSSNEQIEASKKWIESFYETLDGKDYDRLVKIYMQPDAELIFANSPPIIGSEAIRTASIEQNSLFDVKHNIKHIVVLPDRIYVEMQGIFIVKNDPEQKSIEIKALALFMKKLHEHQTSKVDIFYDPEPVKQRIEACFNFSKV